MKNIIRIYLIKKIIMFLFRIKIIVLKNKDKVKIYNQIIVMI